ncbi:hypothetical protein SLA2020_227160 [Shorea laevis]
MGASLFSLLFFCIILSHAEAFEANCPPVKCSDGAVDIRFPFRVKSPQPQHCGRHGFELDCRKNTTMIHFPSYGDLVVTSISYDTKRVSLLDPRNCVHEVFLNLNLSLTPFIYYFVLKNYTYLNCSSALSPHSSEIPCLSGEGNHVYTVEPSSPFPDSCTLIKTVSIPFPYSPYLSDNTFGLQLTWDLPECEDCEGGGGQCIFQGEKPWCFYKSQKKSHAITEGIHKLLYNLLHMFLSLMQQN